MDGKEQHNSPEQIGQQVREKPSAGTGESVNRNDIEVQARKPPTKEIQYVNGKLKKKAASESSSEESDQEDSSSESDDGLAKKRKEDSESKQREHQRSKDRSKTAPSLLVVKRVRIQPIPVRQRSM